MLPAVVVVAAAAAVVVAAAVVAVVAVAVAGSSIEAGLLRGGLSLGPLKSIDPLSVKRFGDRSANQPRHYSPQQDAKGTAAITPSQNPLLIARAVSQSR